MEVTFWVWLAIIVVSVIVEIATLDLVSVWFAVGSIVPFILSAIGGIAIEIQISVFVVVTAVLIIFLRKYAQKLLFKNMNDKTNLDMQIGKIYRLLEDADFEKNGLIKITDFGIAMALNSTQLTQTNSVMGSVHYLPPEQASGKGATIQSDVYSMGILMYELLTGSLPFRGDNAVEIALKHIKEPFPSIKEKMSNLPQSIENIIMRATAKNVKNRYADAKEMHDDLKTALTDARAGEPKWQFKYAEDESEGKTRKKDENFENTILADEKDIKAKKSEEKEKNKAKEKEQIKNKDTESEDDVDIKAKKITEKDLKKKEEAIHYQEVVEL